VKANRPIPIATARATRPARACAMPEVSARRHVAKNE
jgi:hypothetical protein